MRDMKSSSSAGPAGRTGDGADGGFSTPRTGANHAPLWFVLRAMNRRAVSSDRAPAALGPYSQAIVAGGLVFCSGTVGIDPGTGSPADGIEAQTAQALQNLAAVLEAAGTSMADLVKVT